MGSLSNRLSTNWFELLQTIAIVITFRLPVILLKKILISPKPLIKSILLMLTEIFGVIYSIIINIKEC